jgi:hypothetical protein
MDNPATESTPLDTTGAAALFAAAIDPPKPEEAKPAAQEPAQVESEEQAEPVEAPAEPGAVEAANDDPDVTVKIDGKDVTVKLSELKNGYQRQADYTRKTMEVAEQRKAAEAEAAKARQERERTAGELQKIAHQLEGALNEQSKIDWEQLLQTDPVEYLRQQHLAQQRQAQLQQVAAEQQRLNAQAQAEAEQARTRLLQDQHQALLDKLPAWKDETKAKAEMSQMRDFLKAEGFSDDEIGKINDHRGVILARKAMLYDQMVSKAQAAAKKVATLPTKVEKPGSGEPQGLDRRTSAYQRLSKSGRVEDAAALFAGFL